MPSTTTSSTLSFLLVLLFIAPLSSATLSKNPAISWETYRMCATYHHEGCSDTADPPGPCTDMHDCVSFVCQDERPVGSCSFDMSASWCEPGMCPFSQRQLRNPLVQMSHRIAGAVDRVLR